MADLHDHADDATDPAVDVTASTTAETIEADETVTVESSATDAAASATADSDAPETAASGDAEVDRADEAAADEATADAAAAAAAAESDEERAAREAEEQLLRLFQSTVYGPGNAKIGRVGQVYLDDQSLAPNWVTVKTGLFGTKEYFVPLDEATYEGKQITVPYTKEQVVSAPRTEIDQNLSPQEEDDLYNHYRVPGRTTDATAEVEDAAASESGDTPVEAAADEATEHAVRDDVDRLDHDDDAPVETAEEASIEPVAAGIAGEYAEARGDECGEVPDSVADDIAQAESQGQTADEVFADMFPDRPADDSAFAPPAEDEPTERA